MSTAIRMTRPVTEPCQKLLTPMRFTPFWITVIMTAPSMAPTADPVPPNSEAPPITQQYVRYGASPRGMQTLILAGKIIALLDGRYNVAFSDLRAAALPALRHRIILNFEAQAEGVSADDTMRGILEHVREDAR